MASARSKKETLEKGLSRQNQKIDKMKVKIAEAENKPIIIRLKEEAETVSKNIKSFEAAEGELQTILETLNADMNNGIKKVSRYSYNLSNSKFDRAVIIAVIVIGGVLTVTAGFATLGLIMPYSNVGAALGMVVMSGGVFRVSLFGGAALCDKTIGRMPITEAKKNY